MVYGDRTGRTLLQPEIMMAPVVGLASTASDGITGRRFIAKNWDPKLAPIEALKRAEAPSVFIK